MTEKSKTTQQKLYRKRFSYFLDNYYLPVAKIICGYVIGIAIAVFLIRDSSIDILGINTTIPVFAADLLVVLILPILGYMLLTLVFAMIGMDDKRMSETDFDKLLGNRLWYVEFQKELMREIEAAKPKGVKP